jgi:hypothetical protein
MATKKKIPKRVRKKVAKKLVDGKPTSIWEPPNGFPIGIASIRKSAKFSTIKIVVSDVQKVTERIIHKGGEAAGGVPWRHANGDTITITDSGNPSWNSRKKALTLVVGENTVRVPLKYTQSIPLLVSEFNSYVNRKGDGRSLDAECGGYLDGLMNMGKDMKTAAELAVYLRSEETRIQKNIDDLATQASDLSDRMILAMNSRDELRSIIKRLDDMVAPVEEESDTGMLIEV